MTRSICSKLRLIPHSYVTSRRHTAGASARMARSGRKTVPQIFIGRTHVGGADDLQALDQAGKLDALLAEQRR